MKRKFRMISIHGFDLVHPILMKALIKKISITPKYVGYLFPYMPVR